MKQVIDTTVDDRVDHIGVVRKEGGGFISHYPYFYDVNGKTFSSQTLDESGNHLADLLVDHPATGGSLTHAVCRRDLETLVIQTQCYGSKIEGLENETYTIQARIVSDVPIRTDMKSPIGGEVVPLSDVPELE